MTDVYIDYDGMGELLVSPSMQRAMRRIASAKMKECVAIAPVDRKSPHPGRYKASFHVASGVQHHKTSRAYGEVYNDSPEAFFVEFGTKNNPKHRVFGRVFGGDDE